MRKSCWILAALAVLTMLCFGMVSAGLMQNSQQVQLEQKILYGRQEDAADLTVSLLTEYRDDLFWNSSIKPGKEPQTTHKAFYKAPVPEPRFYANFDVYLMLNSVSGGSLLEEDDPIVKNLYQQMAEGLSAGEECSRTVKLRDYQEFYPMEWELNYPDHHYYYGFGSQAKHKILDDLRTYFRFPVPEELEVKATVSRDEEGKYYETSLEEVSGWNPRIFMYTAYTEGELWFVPQADHKEGERMDYSLVPGGFALYRLPLPQKGEPKIEDLQPVLPLKESSDVQIEGLFADPSGKRLYLQTQKSGCMYMTVLDAETGKVLQTLELGRYNWTDFVAQEDFLVNIGIRQLQPELKEKSPTEQELTLFLKQQDGSFEKSYTIPYNWDKEHLMEGKGRQVALAPDKKRIAIGWELANDWYAGQYQQGGGSFGVEILDENGLVFAAKYHSSLDNALPAHPLQQDVNGVNYEEHCLPSRYHFERPSLCLSWDKTE